MIPGQTLRSNLIAVCGLLLVCGCAKTSDQSSAMTRQDSIPQISVEQLEQKVNAGEDFFLLDVRTTQEFVNERLEFADDLIPYDSLPAHMDQLPKDKSTPIYLFCRSGRRSGIATEYLRSQGYTQAFNVEGGIVAWKAAGYSTISGK